jgi:mRNA-degrading endonuclease RelE of RelBE toxin-antitoxin system
MSYTLHIDKNAAKTIKGLDRTTINRIYKRPKELAKDPMDLRISDPVEMSQEAERKSRVGNWRIFYEIDDDNHTININAVRPRGRAYRKF